MALSALAPSLSLSPYLPGTTTNTTYDKAIENAHKFDKGAASVCLPLAKRGRGRLVARP